MTVRKYRCPTCLTTWVAEPTFKAAPLQGEECPECGECTVELDDPKEHAVLFRRSYHVLLCGRQVAVKATSARAALVAAIGQVDDQFVEDVASKGRATFSVARVTIPRNTDIQKGNE